MSSNKDFLPSSSPMSSICAIEIEAILFLFMMNCYKSSFQECITIIVLLIGRTRNHIVSATRKDCIPPSPVRLSWDSPHPPPESVRTDGRTDGRTDADVRTKLFRINKLPNLLTHGAPRAPLLIESAVIRVKIFYTTLSVIQNGIVVRIQKKNVPQVFVVLRKPTVRVTRCRSKLSLPRRRIHFQEGLSYRT